MTNLIRRDFRRDLDNLRNNMNRILEEGFASVSGPGLAVDMYETDTEVVVQTAPIPGIKPEDIEVSITGNVLLIKGKSQVSESEAGVNYLRKERRLGSFSRSLTIPREIKAEETVASFKENILTITIPKAEKERPTVINIESGDSDIPAEEA